MQCGQLYCKMTVVWMWVGLWCLCDELSEAGCPSLVDAVALTLY